MTEIVRYPDAPALATAVAERLIARLVDVQRGGAVPAVALTGGTVANDVYRAVAASPRRADVAWESVDFWWGDERYVPRACDERNARQARDAFLDAVGAAPERVHEMPAAESGDLEAAAEAYSDEVRTYGSGVFDVVLLGLGPDGHVASLFPGYPQLEVDDRVAVAVRDSPKPPPSRVSLTFGALNRARAVWFVVAGTDKAEAVADSVAGDAPATERPATAVHGDDETLWLLDEAAASAL